MKKVPFLLLLVVLVCVSCSKGNKTVLKASFQRYQGSDAKTTLTAEDYMMWTSGDQIKINNTSVTINGNGDEAEFEMEESLNGYFALYPSEYFASGPDESNNVQIAIQSSQNYNVTPEGAQIIRAPMAAYSASSQGTVNLSFSNLCSLIEVLVSNELRELVHPSMISIYNRNCSLAGRGVVSNLESNPTLTMSSLRTNPKTAYLNIRDVSIPRGDWKSFYVVVPPIVRANNLEVCLYYTIGDNTQQKFVYKLANGEFSLPANRIATIDFIIDEE